MPKSKTTNKQSKSFALEKLAAGTPALPERCAMMEAVIKRSLESLGCEETHISYRMAFEKAFIPFRYKANSIKPPYNIYGTPSWERGRPARIIIK